MQFKPEVKSQLSKYTTAAKLIIYNPERMTGFMKLLGSPEGAVTAVQTVMSVLEKKTPIPPEIAAMLGVSCYLIMVDVAQKATRVKPDPKLMKAVIGKIMDTITETSQGGAQPQQRPAQAQPRPGLLASMQGAPA